MIQRTYNVNCADSETQHKSPKSFTTYLNVWRLISLAVLLLLSLSFASYADGARLGLVPLTQEHFDHMHKHWPEIQHVKPNKLGAKRIKAHLKNDKLSALEYVSHDKELNNNSSQQPISDTVLPRYVNNSTRPSFPPIGDQGQIGSCVAWASTYYQASHEIGMLNGYNNKSSKVNVLSPKWTYNILNGGEDGGLMILDAYSLLSKNGAATLDSYPYDENYLSWDMNSQDWVSAIARRTTGPQLVKGLGGQTQNLQVIKQLLNNGHVLTIGTYINSWVFTTVGVDPAASENPFAGQLAASWMKGTNGGHCMTIVGYNDDIWIDINQNGKVDPGEKGAFLIANSWGKDWGNDGFVWISYDAFLANSAVRGGPNQGRVPAGDALNSMAVSVLPIAPNYTPSLIAQFSLTQTIRNEIGVAAGASNLNQTKPSAKFQSGALVYQGGRYQFDGEDPGSPQPGTFAVDLSDLITSDQQTQALKRFYLLLNDAASDHPTTLTAFTLIDNVHQNKLNYQNVPASCDHNQITPYIDYDFYSADSVEKVPPEVSITSPLDGDTVEGEVEVIITATDNVGVDRVELYVDGVLYDTDVSVPYLMSINTQTLEDGTHELMVVAYDAANNSANASIQVNVDNSKFFKGVFINVGGADVSYKGDIWQKDYGFTDSSTAASKTIFNNPVYQTERYGNFSYNVQVPNGDYQVTLKFAELFFKRSRKRVFNVAINGKKVVSQLDLFKVAGIANPYDLSFPVTVTNQNIKIDFISIINNAQVNAIEIIPVSSR